MGTTETTGARSYASAPTAGLVVVNDHAWDVQAGLAAGDLIKIGEVPAFHKIHAEASSIYAEGASIAAQALDVYVGDTEGDAETTANTLVSGLSVTASTPARAALTTHLAAKALGAKAYNRPIYIKLTTAPATASGSITLRLATFAA